MNVALTSHNQPQETEKYPGRQTQTTDPQPRLQVSCKEKAEKREFKGQIKESEFIQKQRIIINHNMNEIDY
jgi:hypothetical protein